MVPLYFSNLLDADKQFTLRLRRFLQENNLPVDTKLSTKFIEKIQKLGSKYEEANEFRKTRIEDEMKDAIESELKDQKGKL